MINSVETITPNYARKFVAYPSRSGRLVRCVRALSAVIIRALLRIYNRLEIIGADGLQIDESFVLVANHCSHLDTLCLLSALPRRKLHRAFPAAAADYFFESLPRFWLATIITNALPVERQVRVRQTLRACHQLLANRGSVLIIFPEGTRSMNGKIHTFKSGIGALIAGSSIKVIPCYLEGTFAAWPKGHWFPLPNKVRLIIGEPREYLNAKVDRHSFKNIARELEQSVQALRV
jgi:1-acyl-sn-glycerol-3-phosphate acyltransferase